MKRFSRKQEFLGNNIYKDGDDDKTSPSNKADKLKQQLKSVKKSKAFGFIDWLNRRKTRKMKRTGERGGEETMTSTNVSYVRVRNDGAMAIMDCTAGGNAAVHRSQPLEEKKAVSTPQKVDIIECSSSPISFIDDDDDDDDDVGICCSPTSCIEDEVDIDNIQCSSPTFCIDDSFVTVATSFSPWSSNTSWNPNFFQEEDLCMS